MQSFGFLLITILSYHHIIISPYYHIVVHAVIRLPFLSSYILPPSCYHIIISSYHHIIVHAVIRLPSYYHRVIISNYQIIKISYDLISYYHIIMLPCYHIIILSYMQSFGFLLIIAVAWTDRANGQTLGPSEGHFGPRMGLFLSLSCLKPFGSGGGLVTKHTRASRCWIVLPLHATAVDFPGHQGNLVDPPSVHKLVSAHHAVLQVALLAVYRLFSPTIFADYPTRCS